jgi:hypothetical protein
MLGLGGGAYIYPLLECGAILISIILSEGKPSLYGKKINYTSLSHGIPIGMSIAFRGLNGCKIIHL